MGRGKSSVDFLMIKTVVASVAFAVSVLGGEFRNPVMRGADPHAVVISNTFWVFPTFSERGRQQFFSFSSTNLVDWERHGPVLDFEDVVWIKDDGAPTHFAWAPGVLPANGKFYFYYSVGPQNPTAARLGVAVGGSLTGPFIDLGKPLFKGGNGFEAIDPIAFRDPKSGKVLLYAGGSAGAKLKVFELDADLVSIAREIPVETPPKFTEGAFMHYHERHYYLSYSHGGWRDSSYSVHYASSESPTGPWIYHGAILTSDATHKGPGHHSFVKDPRDDRWLIFYHRWENQTGNGPYRGSRQICIDRVEYDGEGLIRPVVMTDKAEVVR
jgi:beta-xylosidase